MKKLIMSALAASVMLSAMATSVSAENEGDNRETLDDTPVVITLAPTPEPPAETTAAPVVVSTPKTNSSVKTGQAPYAVAAVPVAIIATIALVAKKKEEKK